MIGYIWRLIARVCSSKLVEGVKGGMDDGIGVVKSGDGDAMYVTKEDDATCEDPFEVRW